MPCPGRDDGEARHCEDEGSLRTKDLPFGAAPRTHRWSKYDVYTVSQMMSEVTTHGLPIVDGPLATVFKPYFAERADPDLPPSRCPLGEPLELLESLQESALSRLEAFFEERDFRAGGKRLVFPREYLSTAAELAARLIAREPLHLGTAVMKVYVQLADLSSFLLGSIHFDEATLRHPEEETPELILVVQEECRLSRNWLPKSLRRFLYKCRRKLIVQEEVHLSRRSILGQEFARMAVDEGQTQQSPVIVSWVATMDPLNSPVYKSVGPEEAHGSCPVQESGLRRRMRIERIGSQDCTSLFNSHRVWGDPGTSSKLEEVVPDGDVQAKEEDRCSGRTTLPEVANLAPL